MEQQQRRATANVVVLKGHGEERLRQAITQGLVQDDLMRDFREVLDTVDQLRGELNLAYCQLQDEQRSSYHLKEVVYKAMEAERREKARKQKISDVKVYSAVGGIAFGFIFISVLLCSWIIGLF